MLRTTLLRCDLLKCSFRKGVIRTNFIRCLGVQCVHNKYLHRHGNSIMDKRVLLLVSKPELCCRYYSADYPPHNKVLLPALSPTMEMGTIISWEKKEGDKLNEGDLLAEIETDKATMGFETPEEGYLAKIIVAAGTKDVQIGKLVCIIVENAEDVAAFKDYSDTSEPAVSTVPAVAAPSAPVPTAAPTPAPAAAAPVVSPTPTDGTRLFVSPLARKLAAEQGLQLKAIGHGSGLYGSITSQDLAGAPSAATAPAPALAHAPAPGRAPAVGAAFTDLPVSNMRAVIAKRLLLSKQTIPHYYLHVDVELDKLLKLRDRLNAVLAKDNVKLTVTDFFIKAASLACKKVPEANSSWLDTIIREYHSVDISLAVATDKGLITPIVFEADKKGLVDISEDVKSLAAKAREGRLQPHEFQGGTFSISNLGMFGITSFSAIINPPQSCILSIGGKQVKLIPDSSTEQGFRQVDFLAAKLSCDHRVIDGAVGAKWMVAFRQLIENPETMLL